jgi:SAM-dependent methyltransferase
MASNFNTASADQYELLMGRWSRRLAPKFLAFSGIADGEEVVDVGCGTGSLTFAIPEAANVKRIDGIDFSAVYAERAAALNKDPRIVISQGDACDMPFADKTYDRALSLLVLHHIPDAPKAISEMCRVVRPGGVVAACVWDTYGGFPLFRMFWDTVAAVDPTAEKARNGGYFRPLAQAGELTEAFEAAGLEDVSEDTLLIRLDFQNFEDFWTPIAAGEGPHGAYLMAHARDQQQRLKQAVGAAYESGRPDGPRSFYGVALACRGRVPQR